VLGRLLGFLLSGLLLALSPTSMAVFLRFAPALDAALIVGISLYILGKQGRVGARISLQLPEPRYVLIAALLPVVISAVPPTGKYLFDRMHWAAQDFGKSVAPQFSSYFDFTSAWQPWLLLLVFGAFAEEFVFRGLLLRGFIGRYGFHRGIFLTGIAWAAIHFQSDSYSGLSVSGVLIHLINRVFLCLALNYVFAWMTLRWKSIVPATIAHTTWNILAAMQLDSSGPWDWELRFALLATLACVLFRFCPVTAQEMSQGAQREASSELAV
jgi:membrane protease YdiL (CAAX protease family)